MGTGVGEAMLLGAAVGGGSAAMTGGDPLKGALLGGLTGGAGAGVSGALAGGAEAGALTGATAGTTSGLTGGTLGSGLGNSLAAMEPTLGASTNFALNAPSAGLNASSSLSGLNPSLAQASMQSGTNFALNAPSIAPGASSAYSLGAPSIAPGAGISALPNAVSPTTAAAPMGNSFTQAMQDPTKYIMDNKFKMAAAGMAGAMGSRPDAYMPEEYNGPLKRFRINESLYRPAMFEEGGITTLASGGNAGGISSLGSYSDGGRMLRGPGDGMSDSIPASISGKRPARLADGEFVVPADVVSHLGNGSTDAGAKTLYGMMDKVRSARTGRKSQGREINPSKYMPV